MFYEQEDIKKELVCPQCSSVYDSERNKPRILACCGETICSNCSATLTEAFRSMMLIKCKFCADFIPNSSLQLNKDKQMPEVFFTNKLALRILQKEPRDVYRGKRVELVKFLLRQLEPELAKLKKIKTMTESERIVEFCEDLETQINAATHNEIINLSRMNQYLMEQVNRFRLESVEYNIEANDKAQARNEDRFGIEYLYRLINEVETFHDEWTSYLKLAQIDEDRIVRGALSKSYEYRITLHKENLKQYSILFNGKLPVFHWKTPHEQTISVTVEARLNFSNIRYMEFEKLRLDQLTRVDLNYLLENVRNKAYPVRLVSLQNGKFFLACTDLHVSYLTHVMIVDRRGVLAIKFDIYEFLSLACVNESNGKLLIQTDSYKNNSNQYFIQYLDLSDTNVELSMTNKDQEQNVTGHLTEKRQFVGEHGYDRIAIGDKYVYATNRAQNQFDLYDLDLQRLKSFTDFSTVQPIASSLATILNDAMTLEYLARNGRIYVRSKQNQLMIIDEDGFSLIRWVKPDDVLPDFSESKFQSNMLINKEDKLFLFNEGSLVIYDLSFEFEEERPANQATWTTLKEDTPRIKTIKTEHKIEFVDYNFVESKFTILFDQDEESLLFDQNSNTLIFVE